MKILLPFFLFIFLSHFLNAQSKLNFEKLDDAVVLIKIYNSDNEYLGHGSGFVIDSTGVVVTNYHVLKNGYYFKVQFDINGTKKIYDVDKILSGDDNFDLAKLSLKNIDNFKFPYLKISNTIPSKGEDCWAIGTPADPKFMNTISKGLVSNLLFDQSPRVIQTNAEITHGSSGGALLNSKGEVIGVTSAGDVSEDGARASINFAIWIQEINKLNAINKERIIENVSVKCKLSFYTNSSLSGSVYLYVDEIFCGSFNKYFPSSVPDCGADGTITLNLLAGTHKYMVYYETMGKAYLGSTTIAPGQCQLLLVHGPSNTRTSSTTSNNNVLLPFKKFNNKNIYNWTISLGIAKGYYNSYSSSEYWAKSILLERYFKSYKYSVRTKFEGFKTTFDESNYKAFNTDLKIIWNRPYRFNFWTGPTIGYLRLINTVTSDEWDDILGQYIQKTELKKYTGLNFGLRFGADAYLSKRFYFSSDVGLIKYNAFNIFDADLNFTLGFKFKVK